MKYIYRFFLPHGLTVDGQSNVWLTDVALHQVFKFPPKGGNGQPTLVLGTRFEPGNDDTHFCKPTAVAVTSTGDFFVSDGYCNHRIIKYNAEGKKLLVWGRSNLAYGNILAKQILW
jgi:peptidylamidoglycolate lyase